MRYILLVLAVYPFLACAASAGAVDIMPMQTPTVKKISIPLPTQPKIDDNFLSSNKTVTLYRHKVCILGQYFRRYDYSTYEQDEKGALKANIPQKQLVSNRETKCKYYSAGDSAAEKQSIITKARKFFKFSNVITAEITESIPQHEEGAGVGFNLTDKKIYKVGGFYDEPDSVYKLIITDKNKIRRLYNYSYVSLSDEMGKLIDEQNGLMPLRITIYEKLLDERANGAAVITFKDGQYLINLPNLQNDGTIYDIRPDYAAVYK